MAAELDLNSRDDDDQSKNCCIYIFLERLIAEELMREWVGLFLVEIDKIESFFSSKLAEYSQEFELLKDTFIKKKHGHKK
jgi:hypothetical protein